jgi:hypothetical protein
MYSLYVPAPSFLPPTSLINFLDSNFNLPPDVTTEFDVHSSNNVNIQPLSASNNPQAGALAPEAFKDKNLDTTADPDAVSGYVISE